MVTPGPSEQGPGEPPGCGNDSCHNDRILALTNAPVAPDSIRSSGSDDVFLRLNGISKSYPGVLALSDFSMEVGPGEVIGLVGENGAGKSTLMKVLGGIVTPDAGTIVLDGVPHSALSIAGSMEAGIAFVHQELNLFDNLDSASNVFIGREPLKWGPLKINDRAKLRADVQPYLDQ